MDEDHSGIARHVIEAGHSIAWQEVNIEKNEKAFIEKAFIEVYRKSERKCLEHKTCPTWIGCLS